LGLVLGYSSWSSTWLRGRRGYRSNRDSSLGKEGQKKTEPAYKDAGEQFDLAKEIPDKDKFELTHPDLAKELRCICMDSDKKTGDLNLRIIIPSPP
jgi:hypothetical protein